MLDYQGFPDPNFALSLEQILRVSPDPNADNAFLAQNQWMPHGRIFGGQVLAQALASAMETVPTDRRPHSLHGYFLKAGDITQPLHYEVDNLRDGKSFSSRRVLAIQNGEPIFSMISSFQTKSGGLSHQSDADTELVKSAPKPEDLPAPGDHFADQESRGFEYWAESRPFEIRHFEEPIYLRPATKKQASQSVWMRAKEQIDVKNVQAHVAALVFASDYTILEPILRRHGIPWLHPGLSSASLDHAIWIYRQPNVNDWLLYHQESPVSGHGRGLSLGKIYDTDGKLIATVAQEGMIRVPEVR